MRLFLLLVLFATACFAVTNKNSTKGGPECFACELAIISIKQTAEAEKKSYEEIVYKFCEKKLPAKSWALELCKLLTIEYGDVIISMLEAGANPDHICYATKFCKNKACKLFPSSDMDDFIQTVKQQVNKFDPIDYIKKVLQTVFKNHKPMLDLDNDTYSTMATFRGYAWRGRDCDDYDKTIYPGRSKTQHDADTDYNCNGIFGRNEQKQSYEELFCAKSQQRGIIVLGDSQTAHFHVPILDNNVTPEQFLYDAENEFDRPDCSWATGFRNTTECPFSPLSSGMNSVYKKLRARNLCNHRDYQSIAVNGARSTSMADHTMYSLTRNQTADQPAIVFYSLVGNDVCNPHAGMDHMTKPEQFKEMVTKTLVYLETRIPANSVVFLVGLIDGSLLWDTMNKLLHPGLNITYGNVWDFFDCYEMNACWGWLNKDIYWRNQTTVRAQQLNAVLANIANEQTYKNFKVHYVPNSFHDNMKAWVASGGKGSDMVEVVDGGHPSQLAQELEAESVWNFIMTNYPETLGPENPFNSEIIKIFGNQGGH